MQQQPQLAFLFPLGATKSAIIAAIEAHFTADNPATGNPANASAAVQAFATPNVATAGAPGSVATVTPGSQPATGGDNTTAAQVDSRGFPHDNRIHATPPTLTEKDKIWRKKRGVKDEDVARIEGELLAALKANAAAAPAATNADAQQAAAQAWGVVPPGCPLSPEKFAQLQAGHTISMTPQEAEWFKAYSAQTMQQSHAAAAAFQGGNTGALVGTPGHVQSLPIGGVVGEHSHGNPNAAQVAFGQAAALPAATAPQVGTVTDAAAAFGFGAPPAAGVTQVPGCPFHTFEALRDYILANANSPANPGGKLTPPAVAAAMAQVGVPNGNLQMLANMPNVWQQAANQVDALMRA